MLRRVKVCVEGLLVWVLERMVMNLEWFSGEVKVDWSKKEKDMRKIGSLLYNAWDKVKVSQC